MQPIIAIINNPTDIPFLNPVFKITEDGIAIIK